MMVVITRRTIRGAIARRFIMIRFVMAMARGTVLRRVVVIVFVRMTNRQHA